MDKRPAREKVAPEQPDQNKSVNTPLPHAERLKTTTYSLGKDAGKNFFVRIDSPKY